MGTCVREYDHRFPNRLIGRAVWSFCPKNFTDESTKQKCQGDDEDENGLNPVPVYDKYSNVTYKNIFCARCNEALHTAFWEVSFSCPEWFDVSNLSLSRDLRLLQDRCYLQKRPVYDSLKRCIPRPRPSIKSDPTKGNTLCKAECLGYAILVYSRSKLKTFRNPQRAFCYGIELVDLEISVRDDNLDPPDSIIKLPDLTILFEFIPTSKISIKVVDQPKRSEDRPTTYFHDEACGNFSKNFNKTREILRKNKFLQHLSFIGSVVSIVSLVLLLVTYVLFAELRNLPGKIMLNLTISLLLYESVFLSAGKKDHQLVCLVVAVLFHLFALSSFTWMNVMAYDVHRTFTEVSGKLTFLISDLGSLSI